MKKINLFTAVAEMAEKLGSLYKGNRLGREDILEFMDVNEWFGVNGVMEDRIPLITENDFEKFRKPLTLWLSAYKKPGNEKINLMLSHFHEEYPNTCRLYSKFVDDNRLEHEPSSWQLLDFILSEIDCDITDYDEAELEKLIKQAGKRTTLKVAKMLAEFLKVIDLIWLYNFESRDNPALINEAYSINDFAVMAYCIFNEDAWVKQNLLEKAANSKQFANLWLFSALHFISAMRMGDMKRLPAPKLPYDSKAVLKNILNGTFTKSEACAIVDEFSMRLKLKPIKPSKTSAYDKIPDIKLFVPESLKAPLGIIMAVSLTHHTGDSFVSPSNRLSNIRDFFGKDFTKALNNRRFSSRRSNKSYLQGIEYLSNSNESGKPKGYMLAALARSHKSGIGKLAEITDVYLKDANFTGYTPEFIIREMFERGIFSFIPAVLLEIYAGDSYKMLPVTSQTKLIGEIGVAPHQIEWLASSVERAFAKSRTVVNIILQNPNNVKKNVGDILQNIASGNAPSRHDDCLCLMTAAELPCPYSDRDSCIGCGYEVYTKTAMHTLMSEYVRMSGLKKSANHSEARRYGKILEQAVLPAISEILCAAKYIYKENDMTEILDIVERGIEYADKLV